MTAIQQRTIPTRGPFSLEEIALFGFGHRAERDFDGVMRMAFRVDHDLKTPQAWRCGRTARRCT